ncbi:hypothetical protein GVAV_003460 [Gurleya vavrai]
MVFFTNSLLVIKCSLFEDNREMDDEKTTRREEFTGDSNPQRNTTSNSGQILVENSKKVEENLHNTGAKLKEPNIYGIFHESKKVIDSNLEISGLVAEKLKFYESHESKKATDPNLKPEGTVAERRKFFEKLLIS